MLLVIRRPGYAGNDSENRAESIVCAVDRIGHPTASSPVPTFALKDFFQRGARTDGRRHRAQHPRMSFFFEGAMPQKFLYVLFASQCPLGLVVKLRFLPFFGRFHPTNGDVGSGNFVPPTIQSTRNRVFEYRWLRTEISKLLLPTLRMTLFRFGHAQKNGFALLVVLALRQVAISLRSLNFRLPVAHDHGDCFLSLRSTAARER